MCYQIIVLFALLAYASALGPLTAVAEFDQGGVVGKIVFTLLENGSTQINSSFSSGEFSGWHVHLYPVDYTDDPATRCGPQGTGPHYDPTGRLVAAGDNYSTVCNVDNPLMCEAGDFSGKFGPLEIGEFSFIDSDPILQLMGQYGIIGRSVVIHAPDATASRIACANIILQDDTPQIFVATFLGPVAGSIYFRQSATKPEVDTFIYAKLFYTDGRLDDTEGHLWGIYNNELNILDYSQGVCNLGGLYNPTGANGDVDASECSPSNIDACAVGDLSGKLGTISVSDNPIGGMIGAWTDGNLHNYPINRLSVGLHVANGGQELLACANIVELDVTSGIANTDRTLFTVSQRSPFDPTTIYVDTNVPMADYQINIDGNVRDAIPRDTICYSNEVFKPFAPFDAINTNATFDTNAVGNLSGKHLIVGDAVLSDKILPLTNRYSALGHNVMVTPTDGSSATCGTLDFVSGENVRIIRAFASFDGDTMTGYVHLLQVFTMSNSRYIPGPTLMYWQLRHNVPGMEETVRHNWHVHLYRTADASPSTMCNGVIGGHFNPFNVEVGSDIEMEVCNEAVGTRYQLRCELGDLSGKHGWLVIRGTNSSQETTVVTDSNLPMAGPYTILGRSIAIHSDVMPSEIISCANIEPDVLSDTSLQLIFPIPADDDIDVRVSLPAAIVDALNDDVVEDGEVLVYELTIDEMTLCYVATLRFTDLDGDLGEADAVADRVSRLDQNNLPEMYQAGSCNNVTGNDVTGNNVTGNDVTGNDVTGNNVTGNDVTGNDVTGNDVTGIDVTGGSSSVQPAHLLTLLTSLLGFVITLGSISI